MRKYVLPILAIVTIVFFCLFLISCGGSSSNAATFTETTDASMPDESATSRSIYIPEGVRRAGEMIIYVVVDPVNNKLCYVVPRGGIWCQDYER